MKFANRFKKVIEQFNKIIAIILSKILSSMYFFWFCVCLDGIALLKQPPTNLFDWVNFISQTVIQLLALSVLAFSGDLQNEKMENKINKILKQQHKELIELIKLENNNASL